MLKRLGVLFMAVVALSLPATSGTAYADYPTVLNVKTQWLTNDPSVGNAASFVSRTIYLKDDPRGYGWYPYIDPAAVPVSPGCETYTGRIAEGEYTWNEQLWPGDYARGYYKLDSYLSSVRGGVAYHIRCYFKLNASGNYTWGSGLDPHF